MGTGAPGQLYFGEYFPVFGAEPPAVPDPHWTFPAHPGDVAFRTRPEAVTIVSPARQGVEL